MNIQETIRRILREETYSPAGEEYTPARVVVHTSNPVWRDNIKLTGLQVSVGECYQVYVNRNETNPDKIKCKKAIFATDSLKKRDMFNSTYDDDIWLINTECANVKWYKDKHFDYPDSKHIVTFENISPECIKLIHKGTGKSEDSLQESIRTILREEINNQYHKNIKIRISNILSVNSDGQSLKDAIINVKDGLSSYSQEPPLLLKMGNKYEILDGFHRIAQKILNGDRYIVADVIIKEPKITLKESIRRILREERATSTYIKRRMRCFEDFINKLMSGEIDEPIFRRRYNRTTFRIVLSMYMTDYCDNGGGDNRYDPIITDEIMELYGEKLFKWYLKSFTS